MSCGERTWEPGTPVPEVHEDHYPDGAVALPELAKLRITSHDGMTHNTTVEVDGKPLDGVVSARITFDARTGISTAHLEVEAVQADITFTEAEHTFVKRSIP